MLHTNDKIIKHKVGLVNLDARIQHWMKQGHLSEGHGKNLAGLPREKQYWFAYEAIKKGWSVHALGEAIKNSEANQKREAGTLGKLVVPTSPLEKQVTEKFGYPV